MKNILLTCYAVVCLSVASLQAQVVHELNFDRFTHYAIDDWITYAPASFITTIDIGDEYVYFGTRHGGILRYHLYDNYWDYPYTTSSGLRSNHIIRLVYDYPDNRLYAQTDQGLDVYNRAFDYWEPAYVQQMPRRRSPSDEEVRYTRNSGNYNFPPYYRPSNDELPDFFTDTQYLFRKPDEILDPQNRVFHLNAERVVDNFRRLWLSTDGLGVARSDLNRWTLSFHQQSIANIVPQDIYFDGDNTWIGGIQTRSVPGGISFWPAGDDADWLYYEARYTSGMYDDNIRVISGNKRFLFFGSNLGVLRYDKKKNYWKSFSTAQGLLSEKINDFLLWGKRLYIATDEGLNWMDPDYSNPDEPADRTLHNIPVYQLTRKDPYVLMATRDGVYQYHPQKDQISFYQTESALLDINITAIDVHNDSLWLAGDHGIVFFDPGEARWFSFPQIQSTLQAGIYDIAFTEDIVWFATSRGLLKYDTKRDYWYRYTTRDGLADNRVFRIDTAGDDLWLSTQAGITIFRWYREGRFE